MLRQWREDDLVPFAALNADPEVMRFFPAPLDRAASDALAARIRSRIAEHGVGLWALELRATGEFIGFTGLQPMPDWSPGAGFFEVGWRLRRSAWGRGYATEAAREAIGIAGERAQTQVWSLTAEVNHPSIAVMRRVGLEHVATLGHPAIPPDHPLHAHVVRRRRIAPPTR